MRRFNPEHLPGCSYRDATLVTTDAPPERCLPALQLRTDIRDRFLTAIRDGDPTALAEINAQGLTAITALAFDAADQVAADGGLAAPKIQLDHKGRPRIDPETGKPLTAGPGVHPAAFALLESFKALGMTADQQVVTPKSRGDTKRAISESSFLDFLTGARRALTAADE